VTDLIERLRTIDETIVQRIYLREACSEAADELERLRQRELDLLGERRKLRAEVVKAKVEAETWAECVAELRADRERLEFIAAECGGEGQLIWKLGGFYQVILECKDGQDLRAAIDAERGKP
jgi:hypothetical protein